MIKRIKTHNRLNGFVFSIVEFALFSAVVLPFGAYYLLHHQLVLAIIALGLLGNFSMIIVFGIQSLLRHEHDGRHHDLFEQAKRKAIERDYPHLFLDTLLLVGTLLAPYLLLALVIGEWVFSRAGERGA